MACDCKQPTDCRFAAVRSGSRFLFDVCRGAELSAAEQEAYRSAWIKQEHKQAGDAPRPAAEPPLPPLLDRCWRFVKAIGRHSRDGFRKRSRKRIAELLQICQNCPGEKFTGTHCAECGCCVAAATDKWMNKLAWSSEVCPLGFWK